MKSRSPLSLSPALLGAVAVFFGLGMSPLHAQYRIASDAYAGLAEQYLMHLAHFEWEASYALLAEEIEFKLPDGDTQTRTTFKGLEQVRDFWDHYVENSGNDKASFTNFVHVPVSVEQEVDKVGMTGTFDICYFSAALSYGEQQARVRMHWAFHFNDARKIDGIYAFYDRTPIIEAARKNFLKKAEGSASGLVVQTIRIKSGLSEQELLRIAAERAGQFRAVPGLVQKYYVRHKEPGCYGGVYLWASEEARDAFMNTELAATMSKAYEIVGSPTVEVSDVLFRLRD